MPYLFSKCLHSLVFAAGDVEGDGSEIELVVGHGLGGADKFSFKDAHLLINRGCNRRRSRFLGLRVRCCCLGKCARSEADQREQTKYSQMFHFGSPLLSFISWWI